MVEDTLEIVIQINGKVRERMMVARDTSQKELEELALANETIQAQIEGKTIRKIIAVPNKLVNIVAN